MASPFSRLLRQNESHNLQIGEVIDAIAQTEPELFGRGSAILMPVKHANSLDIPICDARIAKALLTPQRETQTK